MAEILFDQRGDWGVVTLNNPKAFNALTWDMVKAMYAQLLAWRDDDAVKAVLVKSDHEKAFCAGGDIRWLYDNGRRDHAGTVEFFRDEYTNNALIQSYPKPYVALIDGINMGGGVGISVNGHYRVAGDKTLFAMPETGIGLFPDVGGGYFLPRLGEGMGNYLGLTGARAKAADCVYAGIATHYTPTDQIPDLERSLLALDLSDDPQKTVQQALDAAHQEPGDAPLAALRSEIDRLFTGHASLHDLMAALESDESDLANTCHATLSKMSPTSMWAAFEQMRRGAALSFSDNMKMEYGVVWHILKQPDFYEGVRAQIVDKDRNPKWNPATVNDLDTAELITWFEKPVPNPLIL